MRNLRNDNDRSCWDIECSRVRLFLPSTILNPARRDIVFINSDTFIHTHTHIHTCVRTFPDTSDAFEWDLSRLEVLLIWCVAADWSRINLRKSSGSCDRLSLPVRLNWTNREYTYKCLLTAFSANGLIGSLSVTAATP